MKRLGTISLLAVLLVSCTRTSKKVPDVEPAPELVLRGGFVYTDMGRGLTTETLATRDGRIVFVGTEVELDRWLEGRVPELTLDLAGRYAMPGFIDAHVNPLAPSLLHGDSLNLARFRTKKEVFDAVTQYARSNPDIPWVVGHSWQLTTFDLDGPTAVELDRLVGDKPALLYAADNHSAWVNSEALRSAKVTKDTPDPPGGRIERLASGKPSGMLRGAAVDVVAAAAPQLSTEERANVLTRSLGQFARSAVTSFQASVGPSDLEAFVSLSRSKMLTARPRLALKLPAQRDASDVVEQVAKIKALRKVAVAAGLVVGAASLRLDGLLEAGTAALEEPYLNRPGSKGELYWEPNALRAAARGLDRLDLDLLVHAAGDRAVREALDVLEDITQLNGKRDRRFCLTGTQVIPPDALKRMAELGACLIIQPQWAQPDGYVQRMALPALGNSRRAWLYPFASASQAGVRLAMGSEWPASDLSPLAGVEVAIRRVGHRFDSSAPAPLTPDEALDLPTALAAYTHGSAYALRADKEVASVGVGKYADVAVVAGSLRRAQVNELGEMPIDLTFLGGGLVFKFAPAPQ